MLSTDNITFLFTDIEGSTKLWELYPEAMGMTLARHDELLTQIITDCGGHIFKKLGDGICAAFIRADSAVDAAVKIQISTREEVWKEPISTLALRMAIHSGSAETRDGDYFGQSLNRTARILSVTYGGQILLSQTTKNEIVIDDTTSIYLTHLGQHRLKDLLAPETLYQVLHPALRSDFPPIRSIESVEIPNNLPVEVSSFIGRENEIRELHQSLNSTRLITVTGSGGCGKTRLTLQFAREILEEFTDGVWYVELGAISDFKHVSSAISKVLGVSESSISDHEELIIAFLQRRHLVLLLDNCEHLLMTVSSLCSHILQQCPGIKIVATSRQAFGITGELIYRCPSLALPGLNDITEPHQMLQYEGIKLFVDRVLLHQPSFAIGVSNAAAVKELCTRLDGIPLALELAAARVRTLAVEEINSRLDRRFQLLTRGNTAGLPRHQTLRAMIDWSYDLLTSQEKRALASLSLFSGGFTLDAAEKICSDESIKEWDVLDILTGLIDKSLVSTENVENSMRYKILETVRQYGDDRLVETGGKDSLRKRHCAYFNNLIASKQSELRGRNQPSILSILDIERDNIRGALTWASETDDHESLISLTSSLGLYWQIRAQLSEGRKWCSMSLSIHTTRDLRRAKTLYTSGVLSSFQSDLTVAQNYFNEALDICNLISNSELAIQIYVGLGSVEYQRGDYSKAGSFGEKALGMAREGQDYHGMTDALGLLGVVCSECGDTVLSAEYLGEALLLCREHGNDATLANILQAMGVNSMVRGELNTARNHLEESLNLHRNLRDRRGMTYQLLNLGGLMASLGDYEAANTHLQECLQICLENGQLSTYAIARESSAEIAMVQGYLESANNQFQEGLQRSTALDYLPGIFNAYHGLAYLNIITGSLIEAHTYLLEAFSFAQRMGSEVYIAMVLGAFGHLEAGISYMEEKTSGTVRSLDYAIQFWGAAEGLNSEYATFSLSPGREKHHKEISRALNLVGTERYDTLYALGKALKLEEILALSMQGITILRQLNCS